MENILKFKSVLSVNPRTVSFLMSFLVMIYVLRCNLSGAFMDVFGMSKRTLLYLIFIYKFFNISRLVTLVFFLCYRYDIFLCLCLWYPIGGWQE